MVSPADRSDAVGRCRALVVGYHRDIDSGRAAAGIGAFADDAEFEAHGRVFRGRDEILGFLKAREANSGRQTVHVLANEVVTVQDDGSDDPGSSCRPWFCCTSGSPTAPTSWIASSTPFTGFAAPADSG